MWNHQEHPKQQSRLCGVQVQISLAALPLMMGFSPMNKMKHNPPSVSFLIPGKCGMCVKITKKNYLSSNYSKQDFRQHKYLGWYFKIMRDTSPGEELTLHYWMPSILGLPTTKCQKPPKQKAPTNFQHTPSMGQNDHSESQLPLIFVVDKEKSLQYVSLVVK